MPLQADWTMACLNAAPPGLNGC